MRWWTLWVGIGALSLAFVGCSSSSSGEGGGSCPQISGNWSLSGCSDTSCTVTQSGCSLTLTCSPSGDTYTGSLSGNDVSFSTASVSCAGTVTGTTGSGTCSGGGQTCNFTASCQSGACGGSGTGGGGGTGGGSGIDCNQSCSILTGCCSGLTTADCLTGCQTNPNQSPACIACFNDTNCNNLAPCVVANCGLPSELCGAAPP